MVKLFWLEFTQNIAYWIGKGPRVHYKTGDRVIVTNEDKIPLLRHGCKLLAEKDVDFDDVFSKADLKKAKEPEAPAPEPETPAETEVPAEEPATEEEAPETPETPEKEPEAPKTGKKRK